MFFLFGSANCIFSVPAVPGTEYAGLVEGAREKQILDVLSQGKRLSFVVGAGEVEASYEVTVSRVLTTVTSWQGGWWVMDILASSVPRMLDSCCLSSDQLCKLRHCLGSRAPIGLRTLNVKQKPKFTTVSTV